MRIGRTKSSLALVVAFDTTASALAFDSAGRSAGLQGRLCPVPRSLSAGCGMAWRDDPAAQTLAERIIADEGLDDAHIVIMELH